uniref:IS630 family transposase n=1 Tax=Mariniflexile sp. TaxID=1979402 RepID=UPI0040473501
MASYKVTLTKEERSMLMAITKKGSHKSIKVRNAYVLLNCDSGKYGEKKTNKQICDILKIGSRTIDRVKKLFVEDGLDVVLKGKVSGRVYKKKIDGEAEAHIIALSCSEPPKGYGRWSLRLLADKAVELKYLDSVSHEAIRQTFKKNELKPWRVKGWVIPPQQNGQFVADMEKVLDVYKRPYDRDNPVICMDESPKQLIEETKISIAMKPGQDKKVDYEYSRNGVCNILMANEPLTGKRYPKITKTKTKQDWAVFIKETIDAHYAKQDKITLVMDNYGTHTTGSFYETFASEEAKRLMDKIDFIFTPKHGSWLNMAEIEINMMDRECMARRIGEAEKLISEISCWTENLNEAKKKIHLKFTKQDADKKLAKHYVA